MVAINNDMSTLKIVLFDEVRKFKPELDSNDNTTLNKLLFHNPSSMRLSLTGFVICKSIFTAYSFEVTTNIVSKHKIALAKLEFPYYFTAKRLILFSEMDATMVKLHGGVKDFLESCIQLDL